MNAEEKRPTEQITKRRNLRASRPVDVEHHLVFSFNTFNHNRYLGPHGEPYSPELLTAVDKGHVYEVTKTDNGVEIFCGARIADIETAQLLSGRSVYNLDPELIKRYPDGPIHNPKVLKYRWRLSNSDYEYFKQRVQDIHGLIEEEDVSAANIARDVNDCLTLLHGVEDRIASVGEIRLDATIEELDAAYCGIATLHDAVGHLQDRSKEVTARYNRAFKTDDPRTRAELRLAFAGLSEAMKLMPTHESLQEMEEELLRRRAGKKAQQLLPLSVALGRLQASYPVLAPFKVLGGDCVEIQLGDAVVTLKPGQYEVRGNLITGAKAPVSESSAAIGHLFQNFGAVVRAAQTRKKDEGKEATA